MSNEALGNVSRREQLRALIRVGKYRPLFTISIIVVSIFVALLEAIGLSFIIPIVKIVQQTGDPTTNADGVFLAFVMVYEALQIPFTLSTVILGVSLILTVRWTLTFVVRWLRSALSIDYIRELQTQAFDNALDARIEYFDQEGSDGILNAIVTQAEYAGRVVRRIVTLFEQAFITLVYISIAFILSPLLTIVAIGFLGGVTVLFRRVLESGYDIGDRVADANEGIQQAVQAGTYGIRDTKLFGLKDELFGDFLKAADQFATSRTKELRNQQAIQNFYNLSTAISVFLLIYLAIEFADMTLSSLGVFLFAMFRLGPKASNMNTIFYRIENELPHLVRTQQFIDELKLNRETQTRGDVPEEIQNIVFDNVRFSYEGQNEDALAGISFEFKKGEFIGFVGQSGSGKSTIVALLSRMYEPDAGEIRANGTPIHDMDIQEWRSRIAVVRQNPHIFNDTLRYNLTIGNRDASEEELERITRIACIDEFFDELPNGYETQLGDNGVRLSGGQRQRIALARALLTDADILVLDEATSDLDSNLEKQVQESIENMDRDYAIVGIAHRLSTVKNADRIYTVAKGQIIESGQHEELMNSSGKYAELYAIQSQEG